MAILRGSKTSETLFFNVAAYVPERKKSKILKKIATTCCAVCHNELMTLQYPVNASQGPLTDFFGRSTDFLAE